MGADIHGVWVIQKWADSQGDSEHWDHIGTVKGWRNYDIFGLLAGVRGGEPLYEPRGYPDVDGSMPWTVGKYSHGHEMDCHSASHLSLGELKNVRKAYREMCMADGYEGRTWIDDLIALMRSAEKRGEPTEAVFCFDN